MPAPRRRRRGYTENSVREAIERWLEVADLEVSTHERYEDLNRLDIEPRLGGMQAGRPDAEQLERLYAWLQRCREPCRARPSKAHTADRSVAASRATRTATLPATRHRQLSIFRSARRQG